jgi:hypothetical protein
MVSRIHFPRFTGLVRRGMEVVVRTEAWPMMPPRFGSVSVMRWSWLPDTPGMP